MRALCLWKAFRSVLRVLVISLPVLAAFVGTILAAAVILAWVRDVAVGSLETLLLATICGLIAWLFIAVFHIKHETLTLTFQDRHAFLGRLKAQLKDLGYHAKTPETEHLVFKPSFHALLFGGTIRVKIADGMAQLVGPKLSLEMVRKRLRVQNHLENDLKTLWDAERRRNEPLLKRVEITMRVSGKQWLSVYREISEALAREGADVLCEVNLLAQSEEGIREKTVEVLIREWLIREEIPAVIHKERVNARPNVQLAEAVGSSRAECLAGS